jgi:outer membrane protein TolC
MMRFLPLVLAVSAWAQPPQQQPPAQQQQPPAQQQNAPRGTQQTAPVPQPGNQPIPKAPQPQGAQPQPGAPTEQQPGVSANAPPVAPPGAPVTLNFEQALARVRQYGQALLSANIAAQIAHEDTVQARAAMLPTLNAFSQFIYTQPNGTPSGVFVSNDGPHVYNDQLIVHGDIFAPGKRADYRRALAAEAVARARAEIAARGIIAATVTNYYAVVVAQRELVNAQQSLAEARTLVDITQKQEAGGEVAHADVIKAQIQLEQRLRDVQNAQLALDKARIGFAVFLFTDFRQDYTLIDDMDSAPALPTFTNVQALASKNNPDIRAAQAVVQQQINGITVARAGLLPTLSFDYFFGINANQFAVYNPEHLNNLGSAAQAQLTVPLWTWGAARSKIRQAELQLQQARNDLSLTQRQLLANLNSFYLEAQLASSQVASLRRSMDLSQESLRLTVLRYQAGEATVLEVVDAQSTLAAARNAYAEGVERYRLALANLQSLTGNF